MTARPHDALFKAAFEAPENAAAMFRELLPPALCDAIDWASMTREAGSFVDSDLADHHTDLLFSARLGGKGNRVFLYLLLEHQSTNNPDMPLRVLVYLVRIWERFRKEHPAASLPPIIPAVVSHVPGGWTAPRSFDELFDPQPASIPGLADLVPRFSLLIEDLDHLSNDDLKARALAAFPKLVLWALRDARDADRFLISLDHWFASFIEARSAEHGIQAVAQLIRYIGLVTDSVQFESFHVKLRNKLPEVEEMATTFAEQLLRQGGADVLRKLLVLKFGAIEAEHEARLATATPEALDRYLERVLSATTLEAVFAE